MEVNYRLMGLKVKAFRKKRGLTQEKLAELVEYSTSYISNIENAHAKPSLEAVVRIANALKVSLNDLLMDSLKVGNVLAQGEVIKALEDCRPRETAIILENMNQMKRALRTHVPQQTQIDR